VILTDKDSYVRRTGFFTHYKTSIVSFILTVKLNYCTLSTNLLSYK
jgi:hypothetical protein